MPSCNLAQTVHNKWLQVSRNKGGDLYVAAVDNYIRAFLQVVAYYQFLKGCVRGMGPSREELRLRSAQRQAHRTGDPGVIQSALLGMHGADDFCTRSLTMKEWRSLVLRSESPIYLSELTMRLIDQIQLAFLGHIH